MEAAASREDDSWNRTVELRNNQTVRLDIARDPQKRRQEFFIRLIELADDFDHLDHQFGPGFGTDLQEDCQNVKDYVRSLNK